MSTPYAHRAKLTADDKTKALQMFADHEQYDVIARVVGCTVSNIYALTRHLRPIVPRKMYRRRNRPRSVART